MDSLTTEEFIDAINLEGTVPINRVSSFLILQMRYYISSKKKMQISPTNILAAINELENGIPSGTKKDTPFTGKYLKGFFHKHIFWANKTVLLTNIKNEFKNHNIYDVFTRHSSNELLENVISKREAEHRLTGEWLIYARHNDENYYLCLASHNCGDKNIRDRIKEKCANEFDFIDSIIKSSL